MAAAASAGLVLGGMPATAGAAAPSVIGGTLESASAKLPKSAKAGRAQVLAMNIDSGAYGDSSRVGGNGRYSLRVPAGKWALLSSVVPLGGLSKLFLSAAISTRAGEHRTLPLTLKQFKKPRKKRKRGKKHRHPPKQRAQAANVNPRDGRPYKGEAIAVRFFDVSGGSEIQVLRKGMADMLITDLVNSSECEFTVVEWEHRDVLEKEIALSQTEYIDPSTKIEAGHLIDPEVFLRGRVEERPGTPKRIALVAWLEDAKTGAKVSDEVSVVELYDAFFAAEERLAKVILRDLICARANRPATPAGEPLGPPPPPKPVADTYTGTFSGSADAVGPMHWEWNGTVYMDAAQDTSSPPYGGPPGDYRIFTLTDGGMDVQTTGGDAKCGWTGSGHITLTPGFQGGSLWVQLDTPTPAYFLSIHETKFISVKKSGTEPDCNETFELPIPEPWAFTESAHTSASTTLNDSEPHITPEISYDWDYTTRWALAPG